MALRVIASTCGAFALVAGATAQVATPPPLEDFFRPAKLQKAALSPNGRWLAALTDVEGKPKGLLVVDLDKPSEPLFISVSEKDDLSWFNWVSDDWLVGGLRAKNNRSVRERYDGMLAIKRDASQVRPLIARSFEDEDPTIRRRVLDPNHDLLAIGAPGTNEVIVGEYFAKGRSNELDRVLPKVLNVATSAVRQLAPDAPSATSWHFDHKARARLAFKTDGGITTVWWADTAGKWRVLRQSPQYEAPWTVAALDGDDGLIVNTDAPGDGSMELRRFDFAANAPSKEPMLTTPGFDTGISTWRDRDSGVLQGLGVTTDAFGAVWLTGEMQALQAAVDAKLPQTVNVIQCAPCNGQTRVLVFAYSDVDPGTYHLYEPKAQRWQALGQVRPEVNPRQMGSQTMHRFAARDGHNVPVWVTLPRLPAGKKVQAAPAVVLVHGGPYLRGTSFGFDEEAQFLASRGYVVIQPEFRGSEGYGSTHFRAGWKQWGLKMQDDISDSLKFAVSKGWVDPARVCIMGASYGGYATLMGLAKDPEQYRCGVAFASVSDPRNLYDFFWSDMTGAGRRYSLPLLLGDREKDEAILKAGSPLEQVARIKAPLLLMHGALDRRVPIDNAERMLNALRAAGKPVEWVRYPEEGHGFEFDSNRYAHYRRIEAFLAQHLKP